MRAFYKYTVAYFANAAKFANGQVLNEWNDGRIYIQPAATSSFGAFGYGRLSRKNA
jgi:hypothetical protein